MSARIEAARLWDMLRADADWLAHAATPDQKALIDGIKPSDTSGAVWANSPEAREQDRAEKAAARARYEREWGRVPE